MTTNAEQIKSLTQLNEDFENYFANTIIPQLFFDAQLILRKFTPAAMKQFDLKVEFLGLHIDEIKDNFRFSNIIDNIKVVLQTGRILEKEIQTTDMHWYQMNILPYHVRKENRTNGVIITFIDITARIHDLKDLEHFIADHELLLDTIAHDVKNPILALGLSIQMLKRDPEGLSPNQLKLLENIDSSLTGIQDVITELIDTRWIKEKKHAADELVDLGNILEDVRLTLASQISETDTKITLKLNVHEIYFVRRKLRSVLYNLLSNAIKYTPGDRHPDVLIKSYREGTNIIISVSDNGIGINYEEQQLIFEKFRRVNTNFEGSGVGLYLVNTIITNLGGKIQIESELGKGSTFKVFIKDTHC
jgi:two-component system phosphate regulon sensor histidine kinase PhoR